MVAAFPWSCVPAPAPGERGSGYIDWPERALAGMRWPYFALRGHEEGPALAVIAAIHGGEYPGIRGALQFARELDPAELRGSLLVLPLVNLPAFWARTAFVTPNDGKNLGRTFPGRALGTFGEALAYRLHEEVIVPADALIDLHSGDIFESLVNHAGRHSSADPAVNARADGLMDAFGLPYGHILPIPNKPGGATGNATQLGKPATYVEIGCNGLITEEDVALVERGLRNALRTLDMLPGPAATPRARPVETAAYVAAPTTGLWHPRIALEQQVAAGEVLGVITDLLGEPIAEVTAPEPGLVLYYLSSLAANEGDPLVTLVRPATPA